MTLHFYAASYYRGKLKLIKGCNCVSPMSAWHILHRGIACVPVWLNVCVCLFVVNVSYFTSLVIVTLNSNITAVLGVACFISSNMASLWMHVWGELFQKLHVFYCIFSSYQPVTGISFSSAGSYSVVHTVSKHLTKHLKQAYLIRQL